MNQSDVALITFALSQTSRAALKLVKRSNSLFLESDVRVLDDQVTRIRRLLQLLKVHQPGTFLQPRVSLGLFGLDTALSKSPVEGSQQSELVFESTECSSRPFSHFEFVATSGSCDALAGDALPRSNVLLLDFNSTTPHCYQREIASTSIDDSVLDVTTLSNSVLALRQMSDELRNRGDNVASLKIVALVQHAFTFSYPIPTARNDRTCPWSVAHSSREEQLELLQNLFAVAKTFLDASLRLLPSHFCGCHDPASEEFCDYNQAIEELDGARSITFACIVAVVDVIVSSGTILPLSQAFDIYNFFPAMDDFAGCDFEVLSAYYPVTRPELVNARALVASYFHELKAGGRHGTKFGNWKLDPNCEIRISVDVGEMSLFEKIAEITPALGVRSLSNLDYANWFCGLGSEEWGGVDDSLLNATIPELNIYLMLLLYCKISFCPWKLIRKFIFPEDTSGHDSRYRKLVQIEPRLLRSREVDPHGDIQFNFQDNGARDGADFGKMVHDEKDGLLLLHEQRERVTKARFEPNDEHVMCTDTFTAIKHLVYPESDAVYLASLLLVPAMAVPYCLQFFSERINLLQSIVLQQKLWKVLFSPDSYQCGYTPIQNVPVSGDDRPQYFGTPRGLLMHELEHSPEAIMRPMELLLHQICELAEDPATGIGHRRLLLFLLRCSCIIEHFAASAQLRAHEGIQSILLKSRRSLQVYQRKCIPVLEKWIVSHDASMHTSQSMLRGIQLHSSLALLYSIPLFDKVDPPVDIGAFYFSACSVMTVLQAQHSAFCPIIDVLHAVHRLRLDVTQLSSHNVEQRERILKRMWLAQKSGPMPVPQDSSSPWRPLQFDLGLNVTQTLTLTFGRHADASKNTIHCSFPGVNRVSIHVDAIGENSSFDSESFFTIFRSNSNNMYYEGTKERWSQSDLRTASLVADICSDSFEIFQYSRQSSEKPWTVHLHARAPVNFQTARAVAQKGDNSKCVLFTLLWFNVMHSAFSSHSVEFVHVQAAAVALVRMGHDESRAIEHISQLNESDLKELLSYEAKLPSGSKANLDTDYKAHFQDFATGKIYFNIQTAEVVHHTGSMSPIPEDIAQHPDFSAIFGSSAPMCTVLQPETNRRRFAVVDVSSDTKFEIASWKPQSSAEFNNSLRRSKILEGQFAPAIKGVVLSDASGDFSEQLASGIIGIPIRCDDGRLSFCGNFFQPYTKGSCGWFSSLLDDVVLRHADRHSMPMPFIWICQPTESSTNFLKSHSKFVPWVIILAESSLESSGRFQETQSFDGNGDLSRCRDMFRGLYEVVGNDEWFSIEGFALRERGRSISREIVYSSDTRLSLADLRESSQPLNQPSKQGREHEAGDLFSGMPISKAKCEFSGSQSASSEEWKDPGAQRKETLVITRIRQKGHQIVETLVPHGALRGLIPEILLHNFTFWMQGPSNSKAVEGHIVGELRRDADAHFMGWGQEATIELDLASAVIHFDQVKIRRRRVIRRSADESIRSHNDTSDDDDGGCRRDTYCLEALMNLKLCGKASTIGQVIQELAHVDNLSHILVWGEDCGDSVVQLHKIEMPRAGIFLRFQADDNVSRMLRCVDSRSPGHHQQMTLVRVYSEDDDTFLGKSNIFDDSISQFLHAIPHGAVFCNQSQQRFLVAPLWEPRPLKIAQCPFEGVSIMRKPHRMDASRSLLKRPTTKFQVHIGGTFLHSPDIFSSMYLTLLYLIKLDYLSASRTIRSCVTDDELSDEMKWVLRLIQRTQLDPSGDFNPNAVALRLRIALQCCDGQLQECPWDLDLDYCEYLRKLSHVFPQCILTRTEELMILKQLISGSHTKHSNQSKEPNKISLIYENRLKQLSSESIGSPITVEVRNQKIGGVAWTDFLSKYTRQFLVDRCCGLPSQNFFAMHRPGASFDPESATQLLMLIRERVTGGNFSSVGFYPLYEVLAGLIRFNAVGVTDDHSLACMMLQVVWITATKQFKSMLPREDNLCVLVLAMMSARGFNSHMQETHGYSGLLQKFPGYSRRGTSRNVELLWKGEGIRPRPHPNPRMARTTFAQRLEGAACAVMMNQKRRSDSDLFCSTPRGDSDDDDYMRVGGGRLPFTADADSSEDSCQSDEGVHHLDEMYGPSPRFWSEHLKSLGYGTAPPWKENHTAAAVCFFADSAGASNCIQSKLDLYATARQADLNVPARTTFRVEGEDPRQQEYNALESSLDDIAMRDLIDVIQSVPCLSRFDPGKNETKKTPVLSCVFDDISDLVCCSSFHEALCEIPFPATFSHGAAKEFETQARKKMAEDLKCSEKSDKLNFSSIGPDFFSAMQSHGTSFDAASSALFQNAISKLHELHACLEKHRQSTRMRVRQGVNAINRLLYSFDGSEFVDGKSQISVLTERLAQTASLRPQFKFDDIIAICLSTNAHVDLTACNAMLFPLLRTRLIDATAAVMMHAVKLGHIIRCLGSTIRLIDDLVMFATGRICACHRKTKMIVVKDLLISKAFSPLLVQHHLRSSYPSDSFFSDSPSSDAQKSSSDMSDEQHSSRAFSSDVVDDELTSEPKTGRSPSAFARTSSLRSIMNRQTSVEKSTKFSQIEIQLKTIESSAATLASLLMEGRDYSVNSLRRIRSKISPQPEDMHASSADDFDPRFLVVE